MKKRSLIALFLVLILMLPVAEAFAAGSVRYIVSPNGKKVNVRHGPSTTGYAVAAQLTPGTEVKLLSSRKGWSKIVYNGFTLYVMSRYLSSAKPGSVPSKFKPFEGKVYAASGHTVNLRTSPDKKADIIARIPIWTKVTIVGQRGIWYKVRYGVSTGYMMKRYIR